MTRVVSHPAPAPRRRARVDVLPAGGVDAGRPEPVHQSSSMPMNAVTCILHLGLSHCKVNQVSIYTTIYPGRARIPQRRHQNGHHPTKLWHRFCTSVACKMSRSTCSATGSRGPKSSPFSLACTRAMTASARSFRAPFGRSAPSAAPRARTRSDSLADRWSRRDAATESGRLARPRRPEYRVEVKGVGHSRHAVVHRFSTALRGTPRPTRVGGPAATAPGYASRMAATNRGVSSPSSSSSSSSV